MKAPILSASSLGFMYGQRMGFSGATFDLYPGEILGIAGESGSGKSTLLNVISGRLAPAFGQVVYRDGQGRALDLHALPEADRRRLLRTELGFVHQSPERGLRMPVSAGANIGERLMAKGRSHYGQIREEAARWLDRVEISRERLDESPLSYSGGMRQRLQIARNLVTGPRLVFMDEPTGGLDVSVQARLLDLIRRLSGPLGLSVVIVTHDLTVARILTHRLLIMQAGRIVEEGLTDRILDDPQDAYTQLLVSSIIQA
jgi:putative phosphonate transport system ATP-binding protein